MAYAETTHEMYLMAYRAKIEGVSLAVGIVTMGTSVATVVAAFYGMNVHDAQFDMRHLWPTIVISGFMFVVMSSFSFLYYFNPEL
jgi:Mg2+ and Co2+ transporter CorA